MRVAVQSDFRQVYHGCISAIFIEQSRPLAHQMQTARPLVQFRPFVRLRQVVAIIDKDRDFGIAHEYIHRDLDAFAGIGTGDVSCAA